VSYDAASLGGQIVALSFLVGTQVGVFFALREQGHDGAWVYVFLLLPLITLAFSAVGYVVIFGAHKRDNDALRREESERVFA
jgi:hypothetical protein